MNILKNIIRFLCIVSIVLMAGCDKDDSKSVPDTPSLSQLALKAVSAYEIEATWSSIDEADYYRLYSGVSSEGEYEEIYSGSFVSYDDDDLSHSTTYYYKLMACNGEGCSGLSGAKAATTHVEPPTLPVESPYPGLRVMSSAQIEVTWSDMNNATYYKLYRGDSSDGTYEQIPPETDIAQTWYNDTTLNSDTVYYYKLEACNEDGVSTPFYWRVFARSFGSFPRL